MVTMVMKTMTNLAQSLSSNAVYRVLRDPRLDSQHSVERLQKGEGRWVLMDGKVTWMSQAHGFQEFGRVSKEILLVHFFSNAKRIQKEGPQKGMC